VANYKGYNIHSCGNDYHCENDTLFATLSQKLDREPTIKTNVEIPVEIIESFEVQRSNVIATVLFGLFGLLK
jgi:hypothetical protein